MENESIEDLSTNNSSESVQIDKCGKQKLKLNEMIKEQLKEHYPEVLELIHALQKLVKKQKTKIQKLKTKLKKSLSKRKMHNIETQTSTEEIIEASKSLSECITEAAEQAVENMGLVYEKTSGLYYDYNSGYYYNAELGLYYDGNSGTYMKYNTETQTYDFHSQVSIHERTPATPEEVKSKRDQKENTGKNSKGCKRKRLTVTDVPKTPGDLEEGECSDSSDSDSIQSNDTVESDQYEIATAWPPCMRVIVKSTELNKIKQGSLHIITYEGGTLGREGNHSMIIPDINISKHHLKFTFNKTTSQYEVVDLGSRNGTLLNGKRLSPSKQESESSQVVHGSEIQLGSTVLLCHIHPGNETCEQCEPGLLQVDEIKEIVVTQTKTEQHKTELRQLRKKYGVTWDSENNIRLAAGYTDRAQTRRKKVGSHNEHEKTQVASVHESISSENKGFKLLSKMGWSEGQSLGKEGTGLINPVEVVSTVGTTGIGYAGKVVPTNVRPDKQNIWEKTQKRYKDLPDITTILEDIFDE